MEAHLPIYESGPYEAKTSDAIARDALPDTGRKRANGNNSDGNFKNEHTGDRSFVKKSTNPDARKTLTATKIAKRGGNMPATDFAPVTTPSVKAE